MITPFSILFEIVSAYGTVGLSLGVSSKAYSLSGACSLISKLLLITVRLPSLARACLAQLTAAAPVPSASHVIVDGFQVMVRG